MQFAKKMLPYVIIIVVVVLVRTFIVTPISVSGKSMYPTLDGGELMLLNKLATIERYDIVVVDVDERDNNIIKRVIGLPGETVMIWDGIIYINGEAIDDEYGYGDTSNYDLITLGEDEYFVLGDNRMVSVDSRSIGPVTSDEIKGVASFIIYPFDEFGTVE